MKNMNFYPSTWQVVPLFSDRYKMDSAGKYIKDLVLRNSYATDMNVTEMNLNINIFSAIDNKGQEHYISDFPGQASIPIKGMNTGLFLKSKSVLGLKPGNYITFRFYLGNSGNSIIYSDRLEERADGIKFLDFEIIDGLTISGEESPEAILRFDFAPYNTSGLFRWFTHLFKGPTTIGGKLVNSLGH